MLYCITALLILGVIILEAMVLYQGGLALTNREQKKARKYLGCSKGDDYINKVKFSLTTAIVYLSLVTLSVILGCFFMKKQSMMLAGVVAIATAAAAIVSIVAKGVTINKHWNSKYNNDKVFVQMARTTYLLVIIFHGALLAFGVISALGMWKGRKAAGGSCMMKAAKMEMEMDEADY